MNSFKNGSMLTLNLALTIFCTVANAANITQLVTLPIQSPAFINLMPAKQKNLLAISSFKVNLFGADKHHIGLIGGLDRVPISPAESIINTKIKWPNEITYVPQPIFGQEGMLVASGFFDVVPLKNNSTGAVTFIDTATHTSHKLTQDKKGYYYHKAQWVDLYGNGKYGVLTARTNSTPFSTHSHHGTSELVYLTPENNNPTSYPWHEQIIYSGGPDTAFTISNIGNDGKPAIYAAEFFNKAVSVIYYKDNKWIRKVIDDSIGPVFNIEVSNLAGNNQPSLLVTNHTHDQKLAGVFAYEIPEKYQQWNI